MVLQAPSYRCSCLMGLGSTSMEHWEGLRGAVGLGVTFPPFSLHWYPNPQPRFYAETPLFWKISKHCCHGVGRGTGQLQGSLAGQSKKEQSAWLWDSGIANAFGMRTSPWYLCIHPTSMVPCFAPGCWLQSWAIRWTPYLLHHSLPSLLQEQFSSQKRLCVVLGMVFP